MKKITILFLFFLLFNLINANTIYNSYLDSIDICFENKNIPELFRLSSVLIEIDTTRNEGFFYKSYAYYLINEYENAQKYCDKSVKLDTINNNFYLLLLIKDARNDKNIINEINYGIDKFPNDIRFIELKAHYFYEKDLLDSAYIYAKHVLSKQSDNEEALYITALYYDKIKAYNKSLNIYSSLLHHNNNLYTYRFALCCAKNNLYNKSNEYFKKLLNTNFRYYSLKHIADNYFTTSKIDSSKLCLYQILREFPDSNIAYINLMCIFDQIKDTIIIDSLKLYNPSNMKTSEFVNDYIGYVLFKNDLFNNATYFYSRIINTDTTYFSKESIQSFIFSGNYDKALNTLNNFPMGADNLFLYKYRAIIYYKMKDYYNSEINFKNAYNIAKQDTIIIFNLCNNLYINKKDGELLGIIDSVSIWNKQYSEKLFKIFFPVADSQ